MDGWLSDEPKPSLARAMAGSSAVLEGFSTAGDEAEDEDEDEEAPGWAAELARASEARDGDVAAEAGEVATSVSRLVLFEAEALVVVVVVVVVVGPGE